MSDMYKVNLMLQQITQNYPYKQKIERLSGFKPIRLVKATSQ